MKYKTLKIKNIASIGEATIDFSEEKFASEPIFLISGKTGSGKTTILDAICLALYKDTPRGSDGNSTKYEDEYLHQEVSYTDVRQYMKRGTREAFVEFSFEGNNQENYISRIEFRLTRNNTLAAISWELENQTTGNRYKKDSEIKAEIIKAVGLDFNQFCRTSMLAQGKFTEFLKSKDTEKSIILEKITGTEIYSKIGQRIYEKSDEKIKAYQIEQAKIDGIQLLSDEEKEEILKEKTDKEEAVKSEKQHLTIYEQEKKWHEEERRLTTALKDAEKERQDSEEAKQKPEYTEGKKTISEWKESKNAIEALKHLEKLKEQKIANQEKEARLEKEYQKISSHRQWQETEITKEQKEQKEIENYLQQQEPQKEMYVQSGTIETELKQIESTEKEAARQQTEASDIRKQIPEIDNKIIELEKTKTEKEKSEKEPLLKEISRLTKEKSNYDINRLTDQITQNNTYIQTINEATTSIEQLIKEEETYKDIEKREKEETSNLEKLKTEETAEKRELENKKTELEAAEERYGKMKDSVDDFAKSIRANMKPGDICPICGQTIQHIDSDEEFAKLLAPLLEEKEKKTKEKQSAEEKYNITITDIKASEKQLCAITKEKTKQQQTLENQKKETAIKEQATEQYGYPLSENKNLANDKKLEKYREEKEKTEQQLQHQAEQQKEYNKIQTQLDKKQQDKEHTEQEIKKLEDQINEKKQQKIEKENKIKTSEEIARIKKDDSEQLRKKLETIITYKDWQKETISSLIELLKKDAKEYNEKITAKEEKTKTIEQLEREKEQYQKAEQQVETTFINWTKSATEQRQENLDCEQFIKDITLLQHDKTSNTKEIEQQQAILDKEIEDKHTTNTRLQELANITDEEEQKIEKHISTVDQQYNRAKGATDLLQKQLTQHKENRKQTEETQSEEEIDAEITAIKSSIEVYNKNIGELESKIKTDADNKKQHAAQLAKVNQAEKEKQEWEHLKVIFGDKQGTTFRKIAQSYVLRELLHHANSYLARLTDRYELSCQPNTLVILIKDNYIGGQIRPVDFVSGGESFIVSLALALGLSSLNKQNITTDILFIDEGFGTLDSDILDVVMNTLGTLHEIGGHRVGIISHVEELKERINAHIEVEKKTRTSSTVTVKVM